MSKLGIGDKLKRAVDQDDAYSMFKYYEPWDVEPRPQEIIELAKKDDVDLFSDDYINTGNIAPHPFQSGFSLSTKPIRAVVGPTQGGKSVQAFIEIGIMCSGELPIAFQYNKGVDTGIERIINNLNIRRWGRYEKDTGQLIDHDVEAERDGTWNCGNITGAGKYPKEKTIPKKITEEAVERTIWVGTTKRAMDESWWPKLTSGELFPDKFIDRTKGNNGTNQSDGQHVVHLINDIRLSIISYESGFEKFESVTVWACFFDEEAKDERCLASALSHCVYFSMLMTPYNGMTYTRDVFFNPNPDVDLFHATAYDSPYLTDEKIKTLRSIYPEHEIKARIWGEHTSESKTPYFEQSKHKLIAWGKALKKVERMYAHIVPEQEYSGIKRAKGSNIPGLMDVHAKIHYTDADDDGNKNDSGHNIAWTVFEELRENVGYVIVVDSANGADLSVDALDLQGAAVYRAPMDKDEKEPVLVANIETTCTPDIFAKIVGPALIYYNLALLAAESPRRGAANGMFYSEMREYKYWFTCSVLKSGGNKYTQQIGIDTNTATRKLFFDEVEKVLNSYTIDDPSPIPCHRTVIMAQECQKVVKNGRIKPDHPRGKTNELLIVLGMALWLFKHYSEQVKCRRKTEEKLEKTPNDSVVSLLNRAKAKQKPADPHFPSNNNGARR